MKQLWLFLIACGSLATLEAQEATTITFQQSSFQQVLQQAAASDKLVFIDCYTSWCAPCKWMEKNVFVEPAVSDFYNKLFVNFKIDMEKGEGVALRERYKVTSFPTYLFVDARGEVVHRTASKMSAEEFLKEAQKAVDPHASLLALKTKYEAGDRSLSSLLAYAKVLRKSDYPAAEKIGAELLSKATDADLLTPLGWEVIEHLARTEEDRLGTLLLRNRTYFEGIAGAAPVQQVSRKLATSTMYGLIRAKDSTAFFTKLKTLQKDTTFDMQRSLILLQADYYLERGNKAAFIHLTNEAKRGLLKEKDADLSFIARRSHYLAKGAREILLQSYALAKQAVLLNPEEYSNQGTLASICLDLNYRSEGLAAARKARQLAEEETSKIQKIAQELVDKLEKLPQ